MRYASTLFFARAVALLSCASLGACAEAAAEPGTADTDHADAALQDPQGPSPGFPGGLTYRIPTRVHVADSNLPESELRSIFAEVNRIWDQAGICFEFEVVTHDHPLEGGFDVEVRGSNGYPNGQYFDAHDIWVSEVVALEDVDDPALHPTGRTMAHELGHALDIWHTNYAQWGPDRRENMMASGTMGWRIPTGPDAPTDQVAHARGKAAEMVDGAADGLPCAEPVFEDGVGG